MGKDEVKDQEKPKAKIALVEKFNLEMVDKKNLEEKVVLGISFMKKTLEKKDRPNFRAFWAINDICQEFLPELDGSLRLKMKTELSDLMEEARGLRVILNKDSVFIAEQMEMALTSLEKEVLDFKNECKKMPNIRFPMFTKSLRFDSYNNIQKELNWLGNKISRLKALRQELINSSMYFKQKNSLFEKLDDIGNQLFGRKRDLVEEISSLFLSDVEKFADKYFSDDSHKTSSRFLMKEIKALQGICKVLSLNSKVFSESLKKMGTCWDKVSVWAKENKELEEQNKDESRSNLDLLLKNLQDIENEYKEKKINTLKIKEKLNELSASMKKKTLISDHVKILKEEIDKLYRPIISEVRKEQEKRDKEKLEKQKLRLEQLKKVEDEIEELLSNKTISLEDFVKRKDKLKKDIELLDITDGEREGLNLSLQKLEDFTLEKEEELLIKNIKKSPENLAKVLELKKARREKIKNDLKKYQKLISKSGLTMEQAMLYEETVAINKNSLSILDKEIAELEKQKK